MSLHIFQKLIIIFTWHSHINIMIPRYETIMSHSTNNRTAIQRTTPTVFTTNAVYLFRYNKHTSMKFFHVVTTDFIFTHLYLLNFFFKMFMNSP